MRDGSYTGPGNTAIDFGGKALVLRSENGAASTRIEGGANGMLFQSGEGPETVVSGLTLSGQTGRAVVITDGSPTIRECTFENGTGGAVEHSLGLPIFELCTFRFNSAAQGAAILSTRRLTVRDSLFLANVASGDGGAIHTTGSQVPDLASSIFLLNQAGGRGGAIHALMPSGTFEFENLVFKGNSAAQDGGAVHVEGGYLRPLSTLFAGNTSLAERGGAVGLTDANTHLSTCTVAANDGYAIHTDDGSVKLTMTILWGNTSTGGGQIALAGPQPAGVTFTYSDVEGGAAAVVGNLGTFTSTDSIDADPLFRGPSDFHLAAGSPCIDAGNPFTSHPTGIGAADLDGAPRIQGGRIDIGVDEQ